MLTEGWQDEYVRYLRSLFAGRIDVMDTALREHAPAARWRRPDGGYFFWLELPGELDGAALREECRRVGVDLRPGRLFSPSGGCPGHVRLSFAFYGDDEIVEGVSRFGRALRTLTG
jgi:2-aminoadipate transaminase